MVHVCFWRDSVEKLNQRELSHSPCSIPTLQNAICGTIVPWVRFEFPRNNALDAAGEFFNRIGARADI